MTSNIRPTYTPKHCSRCGGALRKVSESQLDCSNCGFENYLNPVTSNGVILLNARGEIGLIERGIEPRKGLWDVPGGFVEQNESLEASVLREMREELGIEIDPEKLLYFFSAADTYDFQGETYATLVMMFCYTLRANDVCVPADDAASIQFFAPNELPFKRLAFQSAVDSLQKFIKMKSTP